MKVYMVIVEGSNVFITADKVDDRDGVVSFYQADVLIARFYVYIGWKEQ